MALFRFGKRCVYVALLFVHSKTKCFQNATCWFCMACLYIVYIRVWVCMCLCIHIVCECLVYTHLLSIRSFVEFKFANKLNCSETFSNIVRYFFCLISLISHEDLDIIDYEPLYDVMCTTLNVPMQRWIKSSILIISTLKHTEQQHQRSIVWNACKYMQSLWALYFELDRS